MKIIGILYRDVLFNAGVNEWKILTEWSEVFKIQFDEDWLVEYNDVEKYRLDIKMFLLGKPDGN